MPGPSPFEFLEATVYGYLQMQAPPQRAGVHHPAGAVGLHPTTKLPPAKVNQPLPTNPPVQVVAGGKSPYTITGQFFQITGNNPSSGSNSIGPGLKLNPDQTNNGGITVTGIPTVVGTYNFTFTVDDAMGRNLQQVQYSMVVS